MADKSKTEEVEEVDPFDLIDEDEEEEEEASGKSKRVRNPLLTQSKLAMDSLLELESSPRARGDAERAQTLLKTIIKGRLSPQMSSAVRTAIAYDIDAAFTIAYQDWGRR